jgi:hypothetical protein
MLARFTTVLDSRKKVPMTGRVYLRAIVPIGMFFSLSLMFSNAAYLYLSVAFIQMLKATTPVAVLLVTWGLGMAPPNFKTLGNVSVIVLGVVIASYGEIQFVMIGFMVQIVGILCEATRLAMVERLLSGGEFKMDPLVSLYYFAPACATMNFVMFCFLELHKISMDKIYDLGLITLLLNASVAFMLNVAVVFLVSISLLLLLKPQLTRPAPDRQDFLPRPHPLRRPQGHPPRRRLHGPLQRPRLRPASLRLHHRPRRSRLLQARRREDQGLRRRGPALVG